MKSAKFKDSPLGPIPQDWEVKRLGDVWARFSTGPFGSALHASDYVEDGTPVVNPMHILDGKIVPSKDMRINDETLNRLSSYRLRKNDIILGRRGEMGRAALVTAKEDGWLCGTGSFSITLDSSVSPDYIALYIRTPNCITAMENGAIGTTIPNLNQAIVSNIPIALPPLPEQQRIAEALGGVDKLIESLDEQIEKKRLIAKGVAHDLLSGAKRLPGFKGEWKSVRLGELSEIVTGGTPSTEVPAFWGGDIRWMNSGDVHLKRIHDVDGRITQLGYASSNARLIPIGSVVIALAGQGKTRGTAAITECELCTNQSIGAILPSEKHDSECLYYVLAMQYEKLRAASSGDGTRGGLSKKILEEYIVKLPVDIAEQQAIADLLGEQDAAIAVLEEKREKYARIKEGMMRDLLTGKVRMKGE